MTRPLTMAYLTAASLAPPDAVRLAAKLGYAAVGLRIAPVAPGGGFAPLMQDRALLTATRAAVRETGVPIYDVEIVWFNEGFDVETVKPFLETCGELGARAVLVAGGDPDEARLTHSFAAFCDAARPYGLTADLEFMPWTKVPDANSALRVVRNAGATNGRVLVDALHVARSSTSLADISAIPTELMSYAQICDAPAEVPETVEGLIHTARLARLLPGDGGIDLVSLFDRLPTALPIAVEVPNQEGVARFGAEEWARRALDAAKAVLKRTAPQR